MNESLKVSFTGDDVQVLKENLGKNNWNHILSTICRGVQQNPIIMQIQCRQTDDMQLLDLADNKGAVTIDIPFSNDEIHLAFIRLSAEKQNLVRLEVRQKVMNNICQSSHIEKKRAAGFIQFCKENGVYFFMEKLPQIIAENVKDRDADFEKICLDLKIIDGKPCSYAFHSLVGKSKMKVDAELIREILESCCTDLPTSYAERVGLIIRIASTTFTTPFSEVQILEAANGIMHPEDDAPIVPKGESFAAKIDSVWLEDQRSRYGLDELDNGDAKILLTCVRVKARKYGLGHLDQDHSDMEKVFEEAQTEMARRKRSTRLQNVEYAKKAKQKRSSEK